NYFNEETLLTAKYLTLSAAERHARRACIESDVGQSGCRIAKSFDAVDTELVRHSQEEVGHWLRDMLHKSARCKGPAPSAGKNDPQMGGSMTIAVGIPAAINDHRVVQQ